MAEDQKLPLREIMADATVLQGEEIPEVTIEVTDKKKSAPWGTFILKRSIPYGLHAQQLP